MKICAKCNTPKEDIEYVASQFTRSCGWCRLCIKEYKKMYYTSNKDKIKLTVAEYKENNKDKVIETSQLYYLFNKEVINKKNVEYKKSRRKIDSQFNLRMIVSNAIWQGLKRNNSSKNVESMLQYLPYKMEELKQHLESLFETWMNWNNWGKYNIKSWNDIDQSTWTWNIDHIIPQSKFTYSSMIDDQFQQCWSLNNLRPFSSKENVLKGNKEND